MSNSLESLQEQRPNLTKYKPTDQQSHLDHIMFEDWATVPMIRIIKVLSGKNKSQRLYSVRSIAVIIGKSVGTVSKSINVLLANGYLIKDQGGIRLDTFSVQKTERSVQETEQVFRKLNDSVQKTEQKCSEFRTHNISKNINKNISNSKSKSCKVATSDLDFPELLNNNSCKNSLIEFIEHRKQIKKPLSELALKKILNKYANQPENLIKSIDQSIENGWQGLFEVKEDKSKKQIDFTKKQTNFERNMENLQRGKERLLANLKD